MKKSTIILLTVFLGIMCSRSYAQTGFETIYSNPDGIIYEPTFSVETSQNDFIVLCNLHSDFVYWGTHDVNNKIIKMSSSGEFIGELEFAIPDSIVTFYNLFPLQDQQDQYVALAAIKDNASLTTVGFLLLYVDSSLNVLDSCKFYRNDEYENFEADIPHSIMDEQGNIIFVWRVQDKNNGYCYYTAKITKDKEFTYSINADLGLHPLHQCLGLFDYKTNPAKYGLIKVKNNGQSRIMELYTIDSLLNYHYVKELSQLSYENLSINLSFHVSSLIGQALRIDDSTLYFSTMCTAVTLYPPTQMDYTAAILKVDNDFNILDWNLFGAINDTVEVPARNKSLIIKDDHAYFVSEFNYHIDDWGYQDEPNYIVIAKYDFNMNLLWERYYGGEHIYRPKVVMATEDGGCLVTGIYQKAYLDNVCYYALKITEDGSMPVTEQGEDFVKPYLVYPNPCKDKINIHISPDIAFEKAELYDMSGRLVKAQESGFENIDINGIASGTYILKLKTQDGKVFDEKVVVEGL